MYVHGYQGYNWVSITDLGNPLNRIVIQVWPGLINIQACAGIYISDMTYYSSVLQQRILVRAKGKVDAGYIVS